MKDTKTLMDTKFPIHNLQYINLSNDIKLPNDAMKDIKVVENKIDGIKPTIDVIKTL